MNEHDTAQPYSRWAHRHPPMGSHTTGTPPPLRAFTRSAHRRPLGLSQTGTPPPLRAFTRPVHRRSFGLSHDRYTTAPSGFHKHGTPPPLRAFTRRGRSRPWSRSRPKDSPGIQSIQPTHWLWLQRAPPLSCGFSSVYYQASPSASIAAKGGSYPDLCTPAGTAVCRLCESPKRARCAGCVNARKGARYAGCVKARKGRWRAGRV